MIQLILSTDHFGKESLWYIVIKYKNIEWGSEETPSIYFPHDVVFIVTFQIFIKSTRKYWKIKRYLIEVKPLKQTVKPKNSKDNRGYIREAFEYARNQAKWKAAREYCADRMWEFKVITEKS